MPIIHLVDLSTCLHDAGLTPEMGALFLLAFPGSTAAADDAAETACHQKTTVVIMDCLDGLAKQRDKLLNTAYRAASSSPKVRRAKDPWIQAERNWIDYRKASCGWYGA